MSTRRQLQRSGGPGNSLDISAASSASTSAATPSSASSSTTAAASTATPSTSTQASSTPSTSKASMGKSSASTDEKIVNRYTGILLAEGSQKKMEMTDHLKRLAFLRKEADQLEKTDWQFEPIEKLLGK